MKVYFKSSFLKDFEKLPSDIQREVRSLCIEIFPALRILHDLKHYSIKPLQGFDGYFRIKLREYRIGFKLMNKNTVEFMRVKHRKDIYKHFP